MVKILISMLFLSCYSEFQINTVVSTRAKSLMSAGLYGTVHVVSLGP
jgi:hypothetical protein